MARLTNFSRFVIVLALLIAAFLVIRKFLPDQAATDATAPEQTEINDHTSDTPPAQPEQNSTAATTTAFDYTAPEPVNGTLRGVVELGATGFNSFIIRIDNEKNWKLERAEFGASLVYEKLTSDEEINRGLKNYISDMLAYGVTGKNIHFVISSGAKKVDITSKITALLKSIGYYVNTVTPEQEAKLALRAAMPKAFVGKSFVVDIGSGNTKVSWINDGKTVGIESYGAKYYQDNRSDEEVYKDVQAKVRSMPVGVRDLCFIIGGVPFELAKQTRNGKERYTVLKAPGDYKADGAKQVAGINIYKAVADATGCDRFVFDWDANFTIGFLLEL